MTVFNNIAVQCTKEAVKVAGIHSKWNKAMMIDTDYHSDELNGKNAAVVIPMGVSNEEYKRICKKIADDMKINQVVRISVPVGTAVFYKKEKTFADSDKDLIVIDVGKDYTDICHVSLERDGFKEKLNIRLDFGTDLITDLLLNSDKYCAFRVNEDEFTDFLHKEVFLRYQVREVFKYKDEKNNSKEMNIKRSDLTECIKCLILKITAAIETLKFREGITEHVLLLSGTIWKAQEAVRILKDRYPDQKIVSYKPSSAVLLGGSYCFKQFKMESSCSFKEGFQDLHNKDILGEVNELTRLQQDGYWKMLEAIKNKNDKIKIDGDVRDRDTMSYAVSDDWPQKPFLSKSGYIMHKGKEPYMEVFFTEVKSKTKVIDAIEKKAEEIIDECAGREGLYSDLEIVRRLYNYFTKNYCYTKEKLKNGNYPANRYTIEIIILDNGVCDGFSKSMIYLCRKLQIPIRYISGNSQGRGGHAWNMIEVYDGSFRHLDVTWDLQKEESKYDYYMLDDIELQARWHIWQRANYPECSVS